MSAYAIPVSIRKLFGILVALAVLLAPAATSAAMAFAPASHQMAMMEGGHCDMPMPGKSDHDKMGGKSCCIAMCMAVAIAPSAPRTEQPVTHIDASFPAPKSYHGLLSEIATPPPRLA
ncbi:MAG: hypothetical protein V4499_02765 [Pseudomonadota bacterium]